jgi:sodium/hydrogen exchanger 10/11
MLFGYFASNLGKVGEALLYVSSIDGHALLLIFIPLLIFESAFTSHTHTFLKSIWQILILAFPAVAMSIGLISVVLMEVLQYKKELNWGMGLSLASILAATDPVAVVAILKSTGAQIKLNIIIEGESLLNDGSASIFYFVFADMILNPTFSFPAFLQRFARLTLGGAALGWGMGIIFTIIMKLLIHSATLLAISSFLACYLTFFLAEASIVGMHVSGILAVVVLGLYLGATVRPRLNPHSAHSLHEVWSFMQFMMETLLFLLTGGFIGVFLAKGNSGIVAADVGKMFALNLFLLLIRFLVQAIWWPLLNVIGYRISWKEYILMSYSGLRGAIGLAIGLLVYLNTAYSEYFRDFAIFSISTVIIFTVLVQGMTLKFIMKLIRYNQINKTKLKLYRDLLRRMFLNMLKKSETIRKHKTVSYLVNWSAVYEIFEFPKYILKIENLISGNKPLLLDYNDNADLIGAGVEHIDQLDYLISEDEDYDPNQEPKTQANNGIDIKESIAEDLKNEGTDIRLKDDNANNSKNLPTDTGIQTGRNSDISGKLS